MARHPSANSVVVLGLGRFGMAVAGSLARLGHDPAFAGLYAQALVGLVAMTGQQWLENREPDRLVVARHLINLAWNGMAHLKPEPKLITESMDRRRIQLVPPSPDAG